MTILLLILKGILIGLAFGIPIGVVGILTIQTTSIYGFGQGLSTGMSSAAADFIYGLIAALGISAVTDLLMKWQNMIRIGGCLLIFAYGIVILRKKVKEEDMVEMTESSSASCLKSFLKTLPIAFSNPVTIITFTVGFATIGIGKMDLLSAMILSLGVFLGGSIWWLLLAGFVSRFREYMNLNFRKKLNGFSGVTLIILSLVIAGSVIR